RGLLVDGLRHFCGQLVGSLLGGDAELLRQAGDDVVAEDLFDLVACNRDVLALRDPAGDLLVEALVLELLDEPVELPALDQALRFVSHAHLDSSVCGQRPGYPPPPSDEHPRSRSRRPPGEQPSYAASVSAAPAGSCSTYAPRRRTGISRPAAATRD